MNWKILKYFCGSGFLLIILTENANNFKVKYILSELKNILGRAFKIFIEIPFIFLSKLHTVHYISRQSSDNWGCFSWRGCAELKDCFMTYCRRGQQLTWALEWLLKQNSFSWSERSSRETRSIFSRLVIL